MRKVTIVTVKQNSRPTWNSSATTWGDLKNEFGTNDIEYGSNMKALLRGASNEGNVELTSDEIMIPNRDVVILLVVNNVKSGMGYLHLTKKELRGVSKTRGIMFEDTDDKRVLNDRLEHYDESFGIDSNNVYAALVTAANLPLADQRIEGSFAGDAGLTAPIVVNETTQVEIEEDDLDRELREAQENA